MEQIRVLTDVERINAIWPVTSTMIEKLLSRAPRIKDMIDSKYLQLEYSLTGNDPALVSRIVEAFKRRMYICSLMRIATGVHKKGANKEAFDSIMQCLVRGTTYPVDALKQQLLEAISEPGALPEGTDPDLAIMNSRFSLEGLSAIEKEIRSKA